MSGPWAPATVSHSMSIALDSEFWKDHWGANWWCSRIDSHGVVVITVLSWGTTEDTDSLGGPVESGRPGNAVLFSGFVLENAAIAEESPFDVHGLARISL